LKWRWSLEGSGGAGRPAAAMTTSPTVSRGPRAGHRSQREELKTARAECVSLREQLRKVSAERDRLRSDCERFRAEPEVARRAEERQAAWFSKGTKKTDPARRRRKPGEAYGKKGRRLPPAPEDLDETIGVGLPDACPACGGEVVFDKTLPQYQDELIVKVLRRRFEVDLGHCSWCAKAVQGRQGALRGWGYQRDPWWADPGDRASGGRCRGCLRRAHRGPAIIEGGLCGRDGLAYRRRARLDVGPTPTAEWAAPTTRQPMGRLVFR